MRIAIMGSGGIGGYIGAKLAQASEDVTFIARGKHYDFADYSIGLLLTQIGSRHNVVGGSGGFLHVV